MEGEENDLTPFWQQSSDSRRRRLRRSSSLFLNSGAFLIVLIVTALAFIFIIIPPILSFTSQIFRPHLVKKSWDSLNLVLVLFAIVCGFLSRNNGESSSSYEDRTVTNSSSSSIEAQRSNPSTPHRWYEYLDQTDSSNRLKSSSSHPDLRQESSWLVNRDERWRFYDDTHLTNYHPLGSDQLHHRRRPWQEHEKEEADRNLDTKNIEVDTIQVRTDENSHVPEPSPAALAPAPVPVTKRKVKRSYQAIGEKDEPEIKDFSAVKNVISHPPPPPPSRPPPPPPPPRPSPPEYQESEPKSGKSDKKRSTATKDFLTSLRRKKKKQRQKSKESFEFDSIVDSIDQSHPPPPPLSYSYPHPYPPPPPPPPPPPSVFQNLFSSKKGKTRKPNSEPAPPPVATSTVRVSKSKALSKPNPVTEKPPLPIKTSNFYNAITAGSESPPMPIPAPPPPPPFKIQDWKFARHGDFLRIKSRESSRSGTPDFDGGDDSPSEGMSPVTLEGGESPSSSSPAPEMFCSSPDVDTKADNFIARFRAGLRLEKENSIREKDRGKSRFGPQAGLGREQSKD